MSHAPVGVELDRWAPWRRCPRRAEELEGDRHPAQCLECLRVLAPQVGHDRPPVGDRALAAGGLVHQEVEKLDAGRPVVARQVGVGLELYAVCATL